MAKDFFSPPEKEKIIGAIRQAEDLTSGEIKVHVEQRCPVPDVLDRAKEVFLLLNMDGTKLRNGVLFYLALDDHKFAILGDKGIDALVPIDFWHNIKDTMRSYFRQAAMVEGLCEGIRMAGEQLSTNFPRQHNDTNELPDDMSFGQ